MWVILSCAALPLTEEQLFVYNLFKYGLMYVFICGVLITGVDKNKVDFYLVAKTVIGSCFRATLEMSTCL